MLTSLDSSSDSLLGLRRMRDTRDGGADFDAAADARRLGTERRTRVDGTSSKSSARASRSPYLETTASIVLVQREHLEKLP